MTDKSTSPSQVSDSQLHNAATNTLSERYVVMMGDKVLDEDIEQVPDGDKDMEHVLNGDIDMEQQKYIISENGKKDHLKGLVDNDGKSLDEAFHEVFRKERSGRVRCCGRTLAPTLLKKNQEMATMAKMHAMEMASIKEDMEKN
ncbi:hypothetical protein ACFE04_019473 [Oxalis oulophora]